MNAPWKLLISALLGLAAAACSTIAQSDPPEEAQGWQLVSVAEGIAHPWGLAWLPDGRALVTARDEGAVYLFTGDGFAEVPVEGLPDVFTGGQGGLLDIALHPADTAGQRRVYMTLSTGTHSANRTVLVRGLYDGQRIRDVEEIFRVVPDKSGGQHFGSRLLWLGDGTLLMSVGDGGNPPLRIGGMLARDERSGRIWANEHGPRGGDELNLLRPGRNYGWPLQTHGRDYRTGLPIGAPDVEGMENPHLVWTPAHAPSALEFYTGRHFPRWQGSLLSGGLVSRDVRRIELDDAGNLRRQETLSIGRRVRKVSQGPDGHIYILTDEEDGGLYRIEPR